MVASRFGTTVLPVSIRRRLYGPRRRAAYDACTRAVEPVSVDWLSGACLAMRTDVLRAIGGLDERFFLYYEDEELCWQAHQHGDVVYVPHFAVTHVGGASSETGATWPHLYRSMLLYFAIHRPSRFHAARAVVFVRACLGLVTAAVRRLLGQRAGQTRGTAWRQVASIAWSSGSPEALVRGASR